MIIKHKNEKDYVCEIDFTDNDGHEAIKYIMSGYPNIRYIKHIESFRSEEVGIYKKDINDALDSLSLKLTDETLKFEDTVELSGIELELFFSTINLFRLSRIEDASNWHLLINDSNFIENYAMCKYVAEKICFYNYEVIKMFCCFDIYTGKRILGGYDYVQSNV